MKFEGTAEDWEKEWKTQLYDKYVLLSDVSDVDAEKEKQKAEKKVSYFEFLYRNKERWVWLWSNENFIGWLKDLYCVYKKNIDPLEILILLLSSDIQCSVDI